MEYKPYTPKEFAFAMAMDSVDKAVAAFKEFGEAIGRAIEPTIIALSKLSELANSPYMRRNHIQLAIKGRNLSKYSKPISRWDQR